MRQVLSCCLSLLCLGIALPPAAADEIPRQVTVNGNASITAAPDRASINLGIQARNPNLDTARDQVNSVAGKFLALTRKLGIKDKQVQTTDLTMRPEYRWDPDTREQKFTGFFVQRSLTVELDDLELLGELIEGAVDAGVNEVSPPRLDSSRREELHREALAKAAEDAQAKALVLARTLGARLGAVRQINASDIARPPPMPMRAQAMMAEAGDAAATYQAGDIRLEARVNATFDLE